jgi:hypothetical protein
MISKVEFLWNNGNSLYNGGIQRIDKIVEADGFIAYQVEMKTSNRGGQRNSGVTIWQGTRAFNGEIDLEIKPLALWRDGENQWNDHPESRFFIEEVRDNQVVLRCHNGDREIHLLNFAENNVRCIKRVSHVDWLTETAKSRRDLVAVLKSCIHQILRRKNPHGSCSLELWGMKDDIVSFLTTESLYGNPYRYTLFEGKLGKKSVLETRTSGRFSKSPYYLLREWRCEYEKMGFVMDLNEINRMI